jgi:superfamily II DNA or RNA helicase
MSSPLPGIARLQSDLGITLFDHQIAAIVGIESQPGHARACLYHKTGAGKTVTALSGVWLLEHDHAVVIAPPSTHTQWHLMAGKIGMTVETISHAKFRQPNFKLDRKTPVIADEFHLFGGHDGVGWKKLDRLAGGLQAPLILASATPNYNDAERVYCIQHILDPKGTMGGYLQFLYQHCNTRQNPFSMIPEVNENAPFQKFKGAEEFLASLPGVYYLPDDVYYVISPVVMQGWHDTAVESYGYDRAKHRMVASQMEYRHLKALRNVVTEGGVLRNEVAKELMDLIDASGSVLFFCVHSEVAEAVNDWLDITPHDIITGKTPQKLKDEILHAFRTKQIKCLVGTASLATGTDGLDKVCDTLVIVDDTDDDALRRQLIGRILPRGEDSGKPHSKRVYRLEFH